MLSGSSQQLRKTLLGVLHHRGVGERGALTAGRPNMIATLDSFRQTLEDLGGELGLTDPVGGPVVLTLK